MDVGVITQVNTKGQIVIPKKYRELLNLNEGSYVNIFPTNRGIFIEPLNHQSNVSKSKEEFLKILEDSAGSWGSETEEEKQDRKERLKLERKE